MRAEVVVVGAGAAGLWAAAVAARGGAEVLLLEKTPRAGTKVLASGGTRCNLTTSLPADEAARLFGPTGERFLRGAFAALPPLEVRRRFEAFGVETEEQPLEKVFPRSGRARDVRDALQRECDAAGVRIVCDAGVGGLERAGAGWRLVLLDGREVCCTGLVLCPGGRSVPRTGTTGDGYRWFAELGLPLVEAVPALAPLSSPEAWVHALTGVALPDVEVRLLDARGRERGRRRRPLLFTHRGVSGPAPMDLSEPVARAGAAARERGEAPPLFALSVDLVPGRDRDELRARLVEAAGVAGAPRVSGALGLGAPRRVLERVATQAGLDQPDPRANGLSRASRHALVEALKGLRVPVDGTLGWDVAEVTSGGLDLRCVDPGTLRVRGVPDLWVCGEVLDLQGPIGGLNFQAAFATAELAGRDAAG